MDVVDALHDANSDNNAQPCCQQDIYLLTLQNTLALELSRRRALANQIFNLLAVDGARGGEVGCEVDAVVGLDAGGGGDLNGGSGHADEGYCVSGAVVTYFVVVDVGGVGGCCCCL